jgi:ABC-type sulfate transport system substrate-binding protein
MRFSQWFARAGLLSAAAILFGGPLAQAANVSILNVSYDPTRELYVAYNAEFARYWKAGTTCGSTSPMAAPANRLAR